VAGEAGIYLAGYVNTYNAGQADLLIAKIR
jgi:hypothetical protein